jgi:hypothetical protein
VKTLPSLACISQSNQQGPWDQEKFKQVLTEWVITCNQPFDEVEKPEFIMMMNVTHSTSGPLKIPKCEGIKWCMMKMGKETIEGVCEMFLVSLYLDFVM